MKNDEVIDFNMTTYRFFSIKKCLIYYSNTITSLQQHSYLMIKCQNFIDNVNVQSVHHQLQAPIQAFSRLL